MMRKLLKGFLVLIAVALVGYCLGADTNITLAVAAAAAFGSLVVRIGG